MQSLRNQLRSATQSQHVKVDADYGALNLQNRDDLEQFLISMHAAFEVVEAFLEDANTEISLPPRQSLRGLAAPPPEAKFARRCRREAEACARVVGWVGG